MRRGSAETQANPPDAFSRPVPAEPSLAVGLPHSRIFFGILLAFLGLGIEAIGFAITFLIPYASTQTFNDVVVRFGIATATGAAGVALWGVGLFLVFFNVARLRPATQPWTSGAAIILLVTGITGALLQVLQFGNVVGLMSGTAQISSITVLQTTSAIQAAVALAGSMSLIAGLFGLTSPRTSGSLSAATPFRRVAYRSILSPTVS